VGQLSAPLDALKTGDPSLILQTAWATVGVFSFTGDPRWTYAVQGQPLFEWITAVFFYLGLALSLWRWRQPTYAFALIWLAVGMLPSAITPQAPSFIRLIGAMPIIFLLPGTAVSFIGQRIGQWRTLKMGRWVASALILALLFINGTRTIQTARLWNNAEQVRLEHYQSVLLDMAQHWQTQPTTQLVIADSFFEPIDADSLRRDAGGDLNARWVQFGAGAAGAMVYPNGGNGENGRLYVPEYAPLPDNLRQRAEINETPLYRSETYPSFAIYQLPSKPAAPIHNENYTFGNSMTLIGYEIIDGEPLELFTYWEVNDPLPADLSIFIHLLNTDGEIVAQHDGLDAAAGLLQDGDRVLQRHVLPLPAGVQGEMTVRLGLYERENGRRLPTETGDDTITLPSFTVDEKE